MVRSAQIFTRSDEIPEIAGCLAARFVNHVCDCGSLRMCDISARLQIFPAKVRELRAITVINGVRLLGGDSFWRVDNNRNALFSTRATLRRRVLHHNAF